MPQEPSDPELVPPPRRVPLSLNVRVTLGGMLPFIAWVALTIGGSVATVVIGNSEIGSILRRPSVWAETRGTMVAQHSIPIRWNGNEVHRVEFTYSVDDESYRAASYTSSPPSKPRVTVEYADDDPTFARIRGSRLRPLPVAVCVVAVFPLGGLCVLAAGLWLGRRRVRMLRIGHFAWGQLIGDVATSGTINDRAIHRLEFAYIDRDGHVQVARVESHREHLRDGGARRRVLYEPGSEHREVIEAIPGSPRVGTDGRFEPVPFRELAPVLSMPVVAAIAIALGTVLIV